MSPVCDVLDVNFGTFTVEEKALEQLYSKDSKDDKESAADEDNVSNWLEA